MLVFRLPPMKMKVKGGGGQGGKVLCKGGERVIRHTVEEGTTRVWGDTMRYYRLDSIIVIIEIQTMWARNDGAIRSCLGHVRDRVRDQRGPTPTLTPDPGHVQGWKMKCKPVKAVG